MIIETIEDSQEVVRRSVNLFWKATHGKIASIIFDQHQGVTITFNDGEVYNTEIDAPGAILMRENFFFNCQENSRFRIKIILLLLMMSLHRRLKMSLLVIFGYDV